MTASLLTYHGFIEHLQKNCAKAETMLEKLEVGEAKYSYALDDAKIAFAELQEQAKDFYAAELYEARLAVRDEKEQDAAQRLQEAYGSRFDSDTMIQSKRDVEEILNEKAEPRLPILEENLRNRQTMVEDPPRREPRRNEMEL